MLLRLIYSFILNSNLIEQPKEVVNEEIAHYEWAEGSRDYEQRFYEGFE